MPLIQPINVSQFQLSHDPFSFQQAFGPAFAGLDADDIELAALEAPLAAVDIGAIASFLVGDFETAAGALDAEIAGPYMDHITEMHDALPGVPSLLDQVALRIPAEGYQRLPENLQPPPELGGFNIIPVGTGGQPTGVVYLPPQVQRQVSIRNLTRAGAPDFAVGESFLVVVFGPPNQRVTNSSLHDGIPVPPGTFGTTAANGYLSIGGRFGTVDHGEWAQTWSVGGVPAVPVLNFFVR